MDINKLDKISFEKISEFRFSPGDIYWPRKSGKLTKLVSCGEIIQSDFILKFQKTCDELLIDNTTKSIVTNIVIDELKKLKELSFEPDVKKIREKTMKWLANGLWFQNTPFHLIDLVKVGDQVFMNFDIEQRKKLQERSVMFYSRGALIGGLFSLLAFSLGYIDYKFLQDLYHVAFLLDYDFGGETSTFNINNALEEERVIAGTGSTFLKSAGCTKELSSFISHTTTSFNITQKEFEKTFHNKNVLKLIKYHHEKINGKGFPKEVIGLQMNDLLELLIFSCNFFQFEFHKFEYNDGKGLLQVKGKDDVQYGENISRNLYHQLESVFSMFDQDREDVA